MFDSVDNEDAKRREANAEQAEYRPQLLSGMRAQVQLDLARHYVELQQLQLSGKTQRLVDLRRTIRALETELATLERLGEGLRSWL